MLCGLRTCIFYSEPHGYIGLAHAGWRGTYGQIVKEMLKSGF